MSDYKHPEVLVSTHWVAQNLNTPGLRLVEVDVDTTAYAQSHIPGAVGWNWQTQLQDHVRRDLVDKLALERLLGESGITPETTILLYGDNNNWFAAYAFWQLKYHGHRDVRLIDGGRKKWLAEGLLTTTELPDITKTTIALLMSTNPFGHEEKTCWPWCETRNAVNSWMCAPPTNSPVESLHLRGFPKPLNARGTFPAPQIFHGPKRRVRMARSNCLKN